MSDKSVSFRIAATETGSAQVQGLARAAEQASAAEAQLAAQMRAASVAAQGMAKGTNGAASAAGNLRFQMFDVVQQLSAGQNPMMIANQQGFQIAQAFSSAGQSGATMGQTIMAALGPIAAMLPIVAVAAAGVTLAYQGLTAESEQAAAVQAAFGRSAKATAEIMDDATDSIRRLKLITAGASKEAIAASDSWAGLRDRYEEATAASDALVKSNAKILASKGVPESWDVAIGTVSRGMGDLADAIDRVDGGIAGLAVNTGLFAFLTTAMDGLSTSTAELKEQTYAEIGAMMQARGAAVLAAEARRAETVATKNQSEEAKKGARVKKEETQSAQALAAALWKVTEGWIAAAAAEMDAERFAPPPVSEWEALANQIDALVPQKTLTDMEKLAELSARVTEALGGGKLTAEQAAALTAQLSTASSAVAADSAPGRSAAAGKVGQAMSSPLSAAVGADPTGIAAAVLAGLQSAANMEDGKSVFNDAAALITDALANLGPFVESAFAAVGDIIAQAPVLLIRAIPSILSAVTTGIPKLIGALVGAVPDVIVALAGMIPEMLPDLLAMFIQLLVGAVPQLIIGLIQAFTDPAFYVAIAEAFAAGIERAFAGKDASAEENMFLGSGTTAGGGFQLFGAQIVADEKSAANPRPTTIWIQAGDLWADFGREIGIEESKLGRT